MLFIMPYVKLLPRIIGHNQRKYRPLQSANPNIVMDAPIRSHRRTAGRGHQSILGQPLLADQSRRAAGDSAADLVRRAGWHAALATRRATSACLGAAHTRRTRHDSGNDDPAAGRRGFRARLPVDRGTVRARTLLGIPRAVGADW